MLNVLEIVDLIDYVHEAATARDFARVVDLLEAVPYELLLSQPELGHYLAQALSQLDRLGETEALLHDLDRVCWSRGNDRLFRRRQNLLAVAHVRRGDIMQAENILRDVQLASEVAGDQMFLGTATMNLGVLADMRCDWNAATVHYRYALVIFQRLGDRASIAGVYHNLGMLFRQIGEPNDAETYLDRALEHYDPLGTAQERIATNVERSLTIAERGDLDGALELVRRTSRDALDMANQRLWAECCRAEGKILASIGDLAAAEETLKSALQLAGSEDDLLLKAEIQEELAIVAVYGGHDDTATELSVRATAAYSRLGTPMRTRLMQERLTIARQRALH